jgi:long-chain acyl-CoA synthetase
MSITPETGTPRRLDEAFQRWTAIQPQGPALIEGDRTVSYGELDALVNVAAGKMVTAGIRPGDRVLLVGENSIALIVCIFAASRINAWSATVNARLSEREILNFLDHSGARRALYFSIGSPQATEHGHARGAEVVHWEGIGELMLGALNEVTVPEPMPSDTSRQVAAMVYTSGTTGAPKAVMLSHANLLFVAGNSVRMRGLTSEDVVYAVLPFSHVYGLSTVLLGSLLAGAAIHLEPRYKPESLAEALAGRGISIMHGAPAMYAKLMEWSETSGTPLRFPRLRIAQSGGAPLTLPLKQAFEKTFGIVLQNGYGMTEASPSIAQTRLDMPRRDCSVGLAIPGIEIQLHGAESSEDGTGELWVRGPNVMQGYYRAPQLTAETITPDGWLRTGDLARMDPDGAVFIVGRSKELIIRSGFNVYPIEIEQVLNAYPSIVQSAVVGRAVEGNEEVVAFVEPVSGTHVDLNALRAYLKANLSPYKIPSEIVVLAHLPAAATGKVLKKELQQRAAQLYEESKAANQATSQSTSQGREKAD